MYSADRACQDVIISNSKLRSEARRRLQNRAETRAALASPLSLPAATFVAVGTDGGFFHCEQKISVRVNIFESVACICSMSFARTQPDGFKSLLLLCHSLGLVCMFPRLAQKYREKQERQGVGRGGKTVIDLQSICTVIHVACKWRATSRATQLKYAACGRRL